MKYSVFNDFSFCDKVDDKCIKEYTNRIPKELVEIWNNFGFGSFMDGYLKIINPDEYYEVFKDSYFRSDISIPIFATAFGDIITWEKNRYVGIVQYRYGDYEIMISNFDLFLKLLNDEGFIERFFSINLYQEAVEKYGDLKFDECFGFVPILAMGGCEKVEFIKKVKMKEHIALINELAGSV